MMKDGGVVQWPYRLRANLDEGVPHGLLGAYLNSVYEIRPRAPTPSRSRPEVRRR